MSRVDFVSGWCIFRRLYYIQKYYFFSINSRNNRFKCFDCKHDRQFYPWYFFCINGQLESRSKILFFSSNRILRVFNYDVVLCSENIVMIENKQILNMMINSIANVGLSFLALYGGRILIIQLLQ